MAGIQLNSRDGVKVCVFNEGWVDATCLRFPFALISSKNTAESIVDVEAFGSVRYCEEETERIGDVRFPQLGSNPLLTHGTRSVPVTPTTGHIYQTHVGEIMAV